jgi:glyoxylate carboligase
MQTTSDLIVDRLLQWGVDTYFGLPGDGINGFFEALRRRRDDVKFVHVRHEEEAALRPWVMRASAGDPQSSSRHRVRVRPTFSTGCMTRPSKALR